MRVIKKWLFPVLTCLIALGAAVLPPYLSEVRDARQFGQVHTEELSADPLPVREAWDLLDRLELYARWYTNSEIIPSFQTPEMDEALNTRLAVQALMSLEQAGVIPGHRLPVKQASVNRILLWNPADSMDSQTPVEFWKAAGDLGDGSFWVTLDGESGLPLELHLYDPNMAQWLAYKEASTLPHLAEQFFALLGLETNLVDLQLPADNAPWERQFAVAGTGIVYWVSFNATTLDIDMEPSRMNGSMNYDK